MAVTANHFLKVSFPFPWRRTAGYLYPPGILVGPCRQLSTTQCEPSVASPPSAPPAHPSGCWHLKKDGRASISLGPLPTRLTSSCTGDQELHLYYVHLSLRLGSISYSSLDYSDEATISHLLISTSHSFRDHFDGSTAPKSVCVLLAFKALIKPISVIKTAISILSTRRSSI